MQIIRSMKIGSFWGFQLRVPFLLGSAIFVFGLAIMIVDIAKLTH